jgi:hypothetical protein
MAIFENVGKALIAWYSFLRYGGSFNRPLHNYLMVSYRPGKARWK